MHVSKKEALDIINGRKELFCTLFSDQTMRLEVYKPEEVDKQLPHDQDEIYIILKGAATFFNEGLRVKVGVGDFLFVKAGAEHRFERFTPDFTTWVIFYGPKIESKTT